MASAEFPDSHPDDVPATPTEPSSKVSAPSSPDLAKATATSASAGGAAPTSTPAATNGKPTSVQKPAAGATTTGVARRPGPAASGATKSAAVAAAAAAKPSPASSTGSARPLKQPPARPGSSATGIARKTGSSSVSVSESESERGKPNSLLSRRTSTASPAAAGPPASPNRPTSVAAARRPLSTPGTAKVPGTIPGTIPGTAPSRTPSSAASSTHRPTASTSSAPSPRPSALRASPAAGDSKKRLSTIGAPTTKTSSSRMSLKPDGAAVKELDDLKAKLQERESIIEELKAQLRTTHETYANVQERVAGTETAGALHDEQHRAAIHTLEKAVADEKERLASAEADLKATQSEYDAAVAAKDAAESELASVRKSLDASRAEQNEKLKSGEEAVAAAVKKQSELEAEQARLLEEHAAAISKLEDERARALNSDESSHAAAVADLQKQIGELTLARDALDSSHGDALRAERDAASSKVSALESQLAELAARLEVREGEAAVAKSEVEARVREIESFQANVADLGSELGSVKEELAKARDELAAAHDQLATQGADLDRLREELAAEVARHEEARKQLSEEYEKKIEDHAAAAVASLEADHQKALDALQAVHADELQAAIASSGADKDKLEALKAAHAEQIEKLRSDGEAALAGELDALGASHAEALSAMEAKIAAEKDELAASHRSELEAREDAVKELVASHHAELEKRAGDAAGTLASELEALRSAHAADLAARDSSSQTQSHELDEFNAKLAASREELDRLRAALDAAETAEKQLDDTHAAEIEKIITDNSESIMALKDQHRQALDLAARNGATSQAEIETLRESNKQRLAELEAELSAVHSEKVEGLTTEFHSKSEALMRELEANKARLAASEDTKSKVQTEADDYKSNVERLEALVAELQTRQVQTTTELTELGKQLAIEKMERAMAQADLDATRSQRPDTTELDALRARISTLEKSRVDMEAAHQAEMAAKDALLADKQGDLDIAVKDLAATKEEHRAFRATAQADYNDLNEALTKSIEEEHLKAIEAAAIAQEATANHLSLEDQMRKLHAANDELRAELDVVSGRKGDHDKVIDELRAQIMAKDAEIAAVKAAASVPGNQQQLANGNGDGAADLDAVQGEEDLDADNYSTAAALATLSKARLAAREMDALDREMRGKNVAMLNAITNINISEPQQRQEEELQV